MKKKMLFLMATIAAFALFVPSVMAAEKLIQVGNEMYATLSEAMEVAT